MSSSGVGVGHVCRFGDSFGHAGAAGHALEQSSSLAYTNARHPFAPFSASASTHGCSRAAVFVPQWQIRQPMPKVFGGACVDAPQAPTAAAVDPQDLVPKILFYPGALRPNTPLYKLVTDLRLVLAAVRTPCAHASVLAAASRVEDYTELLQRTGSHMIVPITLAPVSAPPQDVSGAPMTLARVV